MRDGLLRRSAYALTGAAASGIVLPLAALALLLSLLPGCGRWELAWALCPREPWRLLSGHLVHWSTAHLAWDLATFVGLGLACEAQSRRRTAAALVLALVAIFCATPWLAPGLAVYRGLSGLDVALFTLLAASCLRRRSPAARFAGLVALVGLGGKLVYETVTGTPLFVPALTGVSVVPAAHLCGALAGLAAGLVRCPPPPGPARPPDPWSLRATATNYLQTLDIHCKMNYVPASWAPCSNFLIRREQQ